MENVKSVFDPQTIFNNMKNGIVITKYDSQFTIVFANNSFFVLMGLSKEEVEKKFKNSFKALKQHNNIEWEKEIRKQLADSDNYTLAYNVKNKEGKSIWIEEQGACLDNEDREKYIQINLTDITDQIELEEKFRISNIKYDLAVAYSDINTFEYLVDEKKMITNEVDFLNFGIPKFVKNSIEDLAESGIIAERSKADFYGLYKEIENGVPKAERIIYANDTKGNERVIEIHLTNIYDDAGKAINAIGLRKDVTMNFLQDRENEYNKILAPNEEPLFEANLDKDLIMQYNKTWAARLGLTNISSFHQLIENIAKERIYEDDKTNFKNFFAKENVVDRYNQGERVIALEYRRTDWDNDEYKWYRNNLNIIKDKLSNEIIVRGYAKDITKEKAKEIKRLEEKRLIQNLIADTKIAFFVNLTKNKIISGYEKRWDVYNVNSCKKYGDVINNFAEKAIHPKYKKEFYNTFNLENMITEFAKGATNLRYEYKCKDNSEDYKWRRCVFHFFEDPDTLDIMGDVYIEDIDEEKKREIELIYNAEHDMLTGLYNKVTTEKYIKEYISMEEGMSGYHAVLIIDIDYFKQINDTFGHAFGDVVLSKVASKISELFRDDDIVGRLGGDEFIVFIKKIQNSKIVLSKAEELCRIYRESFKQGGISHNISVSIGIAFYKEHGSTYEDLYLHSDAALYVSKENGRDQYTIYSDNMVIQNSNNNDVYESKLLEPRDFKKNIAEYVFRILYESNDKSLAINAVLQMIGKHFDVSRVYVFEESQFHDYTTNTFEWCNNNIKAFSDRLHKVTKEMLEYNEGKFDENGIYFAPDVSKLPENQRDRLDAQSIKTIIQFSIVIGGEFKGFVGFDECRAVKIISKKQVSDMQNVANILGVFIFEMRNIEEKEATKNITMSIINGLGSFAYVLDPESYRIMFLNDKTSAALPNAKVGRLCYEAIWDKESPCEDCPMQTIYKNGEDSIITYTEGSRLAPWVKSTVSWIRWTDDKKVCLVDNIDITEYKLNR